MPVQINEIVIRTTVDPVQQQEQQTTTSTSPSNQSHALDETAISEIVLEILKAKKER